MTHKFDYENFLKDKRIALVSTGGVMVGSNNGAKIDSHDVVIRINRAVPVQNKEDYGTRTDILYNCLDNRSHAGGIINGKLWKQHGVKYVKCPFPATEKFVREHKSRELREILPVAYGEKEYYEKFKSTQKGFRPNTGTAALIDLLQYDFKSLHLFGFDFFRTLYDKKYTTRCNTKQEYEKWMGAGRRTDRHDPDTQYLYFKNEIYKKDKRIIVEPYFEKILADDSNDRMFFL